MAYPGKLRIRTYPDTVLKGISTEVTEFDTELRDFCSRMLDRMQQSGDALGLAAPQVGVSKRIIVTRQKPHVWINPVIDNPTGTSDNVEGCLSVPGQHWRVVRAQKIVVHYQDIEGNFKVKRLDANKGFLSIVAQHEIDHLDGILFNERNTA